MRAPLANPRANGWSLAEIDELAALRRDGLTGRAIAARLGLTDGQVAGRLHRLRQAGDPRFTAPAGPVRVLPGQQHQRARDRADADALAEPVAEGATIIAASQRLHLAGEQASILWRSICTGLGRQAC